IEVGLHVIAYAARLLRQLHAKRARVVRAQRRPRLQRDQGSSTNLGLHDHHARPEQAEVLSRRALGNDDRAEKFRLSDHIAKDTEYEIEMIADIDRGQPLDASDAQTTRGIGTENRDAFSA